MKELTITKSKNGATKEELVQYKPNYEAYQIYTASGPQHPNLHPLFRPLLGLV